MKDNIRKYTPTELPRVGDVVQLFNDAFGTGVITGIEGDYCLVERVYASVNGYGHTGRLAIGIERVERVPKDSLSVYVTGLSGKIHNVNYNS